MEKFVLTHKEILGTGGNTSLFLVRHEKPLGYKPGKGITREGWTHASKTGYEFLDNIPQGAVVKLVTSPFPRAEETMLAFYEGLIQAIDDNGRADIHLLAGGIHKRPEVINPDFGKSIDWSENDPVGMWVEGLVKGDESPEDVSERAKRFIYRIFRASKRYKTRFKVDDGTKLIYVAVTHSGVMRSVVQELYGEDFGEPPYGEIWRFDIDKNKWRKYFSSFFLGLL